LTWAASSPRSPCFPTSVSCQAPAAAPPARPPTDSAPTEENINGLPSLQGGRSCRSVQLLGVFPH
jgi:hypothetical protein